MLMATTPPITPPATATVDWTALLLGFGAELTAEFVVPVFVASAGVPAVGAWAFPTGLTRVASGLSVNMGDADACGKPAAGEFAPTSTEAVMLLSATLVCTTGVVSARKEVVTTEDDDGKDEKVGRVGLDAGGGAAGESVVSAAANVSASARAVCGSTTTSSTCVTAATFSTRFVGGGGGGFVLVVVAREEELVVLVELVEKASTAAVSAFALSTATTAAAVVVACAAAGGVAALTEAAAGAPVFAGAALGTAVHLLPLTVVRNAPAGSPGADMLRSRSFDSSLASPVARSSSSGEARV